MEAKKVILNGSDIIGPVIVKGEKYFTFSEKYYTRFIKLTNDKVVIIDQYPEKMLASTNLAANYSIMVINQPSDWYKYQTMQVGAPCTGTEFEKISKLLTVHLLNA
jgi:hypothetical protein